METRRIDFLFVIFLKTYDLFIINSIRNLDAFGTSSVVVLAWQAREGHRIPYAEKPAPFKKHWSNLTFTRLDNNFNHGGNSE